MVDENAIYTAIKKRLDNDVTLHSLLQAKRDSKVVIGTSMPKYVLPMIQVVIVTDTINIKVQYSEITFNLNVYTREMADHSFDGGQTEKIIQRCFTLINDHQLSVSSHWIYSMYAESRSAPIRDMDYPKAFLQGLLCRMFANKLS